LLDFAIVTSSQKHASRDFHHPCPASLRTAQRNGRVSISRVSSSAARRSIRHSSSAAFASSWAASCSKSVGRRVVRDARSRARAAFSRAARALSRSSTTSKCFGYIALFPYASIQEYLPHFAHPRQGVRQFDRMLSAPPGGAIFIAQAYRSGWHLCQRTRRELLSGAIAELALEGMEREPLSLRFQCRARGSLTGWPAHAAYLPRSAAGSAISRAISRRFQNGPEILSEVPLISVRVSFRSRRMMCRFRRIALVSIRTEERHERTSQGA